MSATLEIVSPGAYASLQDRGRRGHRRIGVPWSGALDARLMRIANALVGNDESAPVIECFDGGLQLRASGGACRVAVAGDAVIDVDNQGERRPLPAWRSVTLAEGEVLRVKNMTRGRLAAVAIAGFALPESLGSSSTYARAGLGARPLAPGQAISAGTGGGPERALPEPPRASAAPIRVVPGPQAELFTDAALAGLLQDEYRVSAAADRMGIRLDGPELAHRGEREIVSDATVPGSIQVPGNGQPIVLLADGQTAGGYPKIATVIGADLPRLANLRPGETLRFAAVDVSAGETLARAAEAETRALLASIRPLHAEGIDLTALYAANLVGGVVNALAPEFRPLA